MRLFKKYILALTSLFIVAPIITVISCSNESGILELPPHLYLVNKNIQDSKSRKKIDLSKLQRENIDKTPSSILGFYDSKAVSGGWSEVRNFYTKGVKHIHNGIDFFLDANTNIFAPEKSELITSYWFSSHQQEFGVGIGGVNILKVAITDLGINEKLKEFIYVTSRKKEYKIPKFVFSHNGIYIPPTNLSTKDKYNQYINSLSNEKKQVWIEDSENIYISILHQSKEIIGNWSDGNVKQVTRSGISGDSTLNIDTAIDYKNPRLLKKHEVFSQVGTIQDNGGWVPHIHINAYYNVSSFISRLRRYSLEKTDDSSLFRMFRTAHPVGVIVGNKTNLVDPKKYLTDKGYFNPNNIFNFYNDTDTVVEMY